MDHTDIFDPLIVIGPDLEAGGGMAEVMIFHRDYIIGKEKFTYLASNSKKGTVRGYLRLLSLLAKLPAKRLKGKKMVQIHSAVGKSFYRKLIITAWSKLLGYKVLIHWHGGKTMDFMKSGVNRWFLRRMTGMADGFIALSEFWKTYFSRHFQNCPIFVVNNAILYQAEDKTYGKPTVSMLFMAMVNRRKGIYDLLPALALVKENNSHWHLTIAGRGDDEEVMRLIKEYGLEDNVTFVGWASGDKKVELLRNADVFVLPTYADAFPMSVLEAMEFGMPVISTTIGSIPEMVIEGENGYLIEPGDTEGLYQIIMRYLENPDQIKSHGKKSRELVKKFSRAEVKRQLLEVYRDVLKG